MWTSVILAAVGAAAATISLQIYGPVLSPLLIGAALALVAAVPFWLRRGRKGPDWIVVDGSDVMYWQGDPPQLQVVLDVVDRLKARGLTPVVWFDANVGHVLSDRYLGSEALARRLGLPETQVFVAPRGTPADPLLLDGAATLGARIVSNDRYRDWAARYPMLDRPGTLVRGRVIGGLVALDLGAAAAQGRRTSAGVRR